MVIGATRRRLEWSDSNSSGLQFEVRRAFLTTTLSDHDTALHLAIGLYVAKRLTFGQAAAVAGMPQGAFMRELGSLRIPLNYGPQDLTDDLKAAAVNCELLQGPEHGEGRDAHRPIRSW